MTVQNRIQIKLVLKTRLRLIFLCFCGLFAQIVNGQDQNSKFKHFNLAEGLSQSSVSVICKDSHGFMWFGTEDGLNKYDGSSFTTFKFIPDDPNSISSSYITAIVESEDGFLWIGTKNGLNYYDPIHNIFKRFLFDPSDPTSLSDSHITSLAIGIGGELVIGTVNGLNLMDENQKFKKYFPLESQERYFVVSTIQDENEDWWVLSQSRLEKISLKNGLIGSDLFNRDLEQNANRSMFLDGKHLWIGTTNAILKFNYQDNSLKRIEIPKQVRIDNTNMDILVMVNDRSDAYLLIGTLQGGLLKFTKETESFEAIRMDYLNPFGLNSNAIHDILLDESGILWLGTIGGGINKYDPDQFKFEHYKHYPNDANSLSDNVVRSIFKDKDGELWIGTHGGLNRFNLNGNENIIYRNNPSDIKSISSNTVRSLTEDSQGIIWAGTWAKGLNSFDKNTGIFKKYNSNIGSKHSIDQVPALVTGPDGDVWIGGNYLKKYDPIKEEFRVIKLDGIDNIPGNGISSLFIDREKILWIGTTKKGLFEFNQETELLKKHMFIPEDSVAIDHPNVTSIAEDNNDQIWIGTYGGGIKVLNKKSGSFSQFNIKNGLLNDVIYGILIDELGFVWFTSNSGLARLDPENKRFNYFNVAQGIQSDEFNAGAFYKSEDGAFYFGGINGFNKFYPNKIFSSEKIEKIVFTDFHIIHKNSVAFMDQVLTKHISRTEEINLAYNHNTLSFSFAELNYGENVDHTYEYLLENFDESWQKLGKNRSFTLGSLKPGNYILRIRVTGSTLDESSIKIHIENPYWRTKWAYLVYSCILLILGLLIFNSYQRFENKRKQFELKIRNWESENREKKKEKENAQIGVFSSFQNKEMTSLNQRILERAITIVEDHLDDSSFDVDKFKQEMYMSRSQLHRKLTSLTGYSATKFIRLIRLNKAAELLKADGSTVAEIAYAVGFENTGYFSKCFKETFNCSPSEFRS